MSGERYSEFIPVLPIHKDHTWQGAAAPQMPECRSAGVLLVNPQSRHRDTLFIWHFPARNTIINTIYGGIRQRTHE